MQSHFILATLAVLSCLIACDEDPGPVTPVDPTPSLERCANILTQRECFAQGCDFFTSVAPLTLENGTCSRGSSKGACLYAPESDSAPDTLTFYQRTTDEGTQEILQLNVDTDVAGWRRCGTLDAPPDCDCDGLHDTP